MAAAFGEVINSEPVASTSGAQPQAETIDLNDPRLTSEVISDDATADAYAVLPPLPDGKWRAKLKAFDVNDAQGNPQRYIATLAHWKQPPVIFTCTNVECSVIDPTGKFDDYKLREYWVRTLVDDRKGTSQVATLLRKLGVATPSRTTHKDLMELFLKTLAGEPELAVETAWRAECQTCQEAAKNRGDKAPKPILIGMHRFPRDAKGQPDPMVTCPSCKSMVRAQARIVQFYELAAVK